MGGDMPGVLYHPHFEPSLSWLRATLLVYDHVWSIVPLEAGYVPSDPMKRHLERLPETFSTIAPQPVDIVGEYFVLRALRKALRTIAAQPHAIAKARRRITYSPDTWGTENEVLEISGITKLHAFKLASAVHQMLEEFGLIYGQTGDGYMYTDERAAFLIVSFLAHRIASRLPIRTITDVDHSFFLSSGCDSIESGDPSQSRGALASAVLKFHIPEQIGEISDSDFIEIRKRYEDLRETFPLYLRDLGELIQVDDVKEASELATRIQSLTQKLNKDIARIKKSRISNNLKKWVPVGIGCAVTLGSAFLSSNPSMKFEAATATVLVRILTDAVRKNPIPSRLQGAQSLLLDAKEDILNSVEVGSALDMRPEEEELL
jgi:hypothetical protein